ncbi:MAG: acyl carrier protein [Maribacter sp.]|jgi:acyl carrier protein
MIDKTEFIQLIEEEFQVEDEKCNLSSTTTFKKLGVWSSMLALIIIVQITDTYDVILDEEDIRSTTTINDLYELVVQKQNQ